MNLLYRYSKQYWTLFIVALLLAATNQIFSLLDPLIFRHVIDNYATKYHDYTQGQFIRGAGLLLLAAMGVAFVSRVAKNFQDYFANVIVQRLGAKMYSDGIRHSLDLPYQVFEDQRSGETLGKLQKVRSDVERFMISAALCRREIFAEHRLSDMKQQFIRSKRRSKRGRSRDEAVKSHKSLSKVHWSV